VAVRQNWEGRNWILRATIDFKTFNSLVDNIRIGSTGFAFILNRNGDFQTNPKPLVFIGPGPYLDVLEDPLETQKAEIVERKDESGGKWIVAMAPLKNGQWVLCSQQTSSDAFAVLHQTRTLVWMVFLVGGLIIISVSFLVSKGMVNRIALADREKADMNEKVIEAGRLASIGELAAGIAHEINNPVAIMVEEAGWIDDLLTDEDPNEQETRMEMERAVRQIKTQGVRCKEITHKLLSFARKTDPKIHEVDLNETVNDVISLLKQKSRYANIRIQMNLESDLPEVIASPSELQQVLLNLVNNAMDAIDPTGGMISVATRLDDDSVTVEVSDTGQGIPESILPRIFDPFFTTKPVGQGTGLGLSICFGIIKKLGGDIKVKSQTGQGTVFTVHLRASEESLATRSARKKTTPIKPIASENLI
jgi:two-component system NtrC family sensor kinase